MKVAVLIDNNPHPTEVLCTEHGLSIYFEQNGSKWLFDTGASELFYTNAKQMGIKIEEVDYLILSHGHADHTGGLELFLKVNNKALIYLSSKIEGKQYFSFRRQGIRRNITMNSGLVESCKDRFIFVDSNRFIHENMALVCQFPDTYQLPEANRTLYESDYGGEKADLFSHEMALVVSTPPGLVVFSGCSHHGILNILAGCLGCFPNQSIIACIGGAHLIDEDPENMYETDDDILQISRIINQNYPKMKLITGHCTGVHATKLLSSALKDHFQTFHSGFSLIV